MAAVREDYVDFTSAESSHLRRLFVPPTARLVGMRLSGERDGLDLLVEDESCALMEAIPIVPEHTVTCAGVERPGGGRAGAVGVPSPAGGDGHLPGVSGQVGPRAWTSRSPRSGTPRPARIFSSTWTAPRSRSSSSCAAASAASPAGRSWGWSAGRGPPTCSLSTSASASLE